MVRISLIASLLVLRRLTIRLSDGGSFGRLDRLSTTRRPRWTTERIYCDFETCLGNARYACKTTRRNNRERVFWSNLKVYGCTDNVVMQLRLNVPGWSESRPSECKRISDSKLFWFTPRRRWTTAIVDFFENGASADCVQLRRHGHPRPRHRMDFVTCVGWMPGRLQGAGPRTMESTSSRFAHRAMDVSVAQRGEPLRGDHPIRRRQVSEAWTLTGSDYDHGELPWHWRGYLTGFACDCTGNGVVDICGPARLLPCFRGGCVVTEEEIHTPTVPARLSSIGR